MTEKTEGFQRLSREELEQLAGEQLPERAAMSLINANIAIPINAAIAANVLSDNAVAYILRENGASPGPGELRRSLRRSPPSERDRSGGRFRRMGSPPPAQGSSRSRPNSVR